MKKQIKDALSEKAKGDAYGMTEINNRIEEVKKILESLNPSNTVSLDRVTREICQLFSQPLDDEGLEKAIYQVLIDNTGKRRERYGDVEVTHVDTNIDGSVKSILALLQPKIEWIIQFLEDGGYGDKSKAITWMQFQDKYNIPAGEFSLVEELKIALKGEE